MFNFCLTKDFPNNNLGPRAAKLNLKLFLVFFFLNVFEVKMGKKYKDVDDDREKFSKLDELAEEEDEDAIVR